MENFREEYIQELKSYFRSDERRINHALKVLKFAEQIMQGEGIDEETGKIITITAILHDVGIKVAEQKYHSSSGMYQEIEGPPIVREIMTRRNEPAALVDRVAYIVGGHHTAFKNNGLDFQVIWEADLLVNIEEDGLDKSDKLSEIIEKNFRTATGIRIAHKLYL